MHLPYNTSLMTSITPLNIRNDTMPLCPMCAPRKSSLASPTHHVKLQPFTNIAVQPLRRNIANVVRFSTCFFCLPPIFPIVSATIITPSPFQQKIRR